MTTDRLTYSELSPVAKRESDLIDRLLDRSDYILERTASIEGFYNAEIYRDADGKAIAVSAPADADLDLLNYRLEGEIDRHVDLGSARVEGDRILYGLKETVESSYLPEFDEERILRLISSRFI